MRGLGGVMLWEGGIGGSESVGMESIGGIDISYQFS